MSIKQDQGTSSSGGSSVTVTSPVGGGTEAAAVRVTVATDSTGVLSVDDNGSSITVDGSLTTVSTVTNLAQQGGVAISLNTGVRDAGTQRVTIATDDSVPVTFTNSTDVATQTTLASALTSLQTIDNIVSGAGVNITQIGSAAAPIGAGVEATAVRVTLPTDCTGVLTVKQATAANLNVTEASASAIKTAVEIIDNAISGTEMQVDVVAALPAGTNAIGKLAANTGVDIGDVDVTSVVPGTGATNLGKAEDVAHSSGDVGVMALAVRLDTPVSGANASGSADYVPLITDSFGKLWVSGSYAEDLAHTAADPLIAVATRRIDTAATSSGTSGDYSTLDSSAEGAVWSTLTPTTTSGCSVFMASSSDGSTALVATAQAIKASAGNLYGYYIYNPNASATYVHLYNTAAASVTVGTTNPLVSFCIPASSAANLTFPYPVTFSNAGWSVAATTTGGGNTAPASGLEAVFFYK